MAVGVHHRNQDQEGVRDYPGYLQEDGAARNMLDHGNVVGEVGEEADEAEYSGRTAQELVTGACVCEMVSRWL